MAYSVGTGPGQINASNYVFFVPPPGMTVSVNEAALRQKYPNLFQSVSRRGEPARYLTPEQIANYDAWETYLNANGPAGRQQRITQGWQDVLKSNPELLGAMGSAYGKDASGNVVWMPEGYQRNPTTGAMEEEPFWKRHPALTVGLGTAAVAGGAVAAPYLFGGAGPASTTAGLGPSTAANMASTSAVVGGSTVPPSLAAVGGGGGAMAGVGAIARSPVAGAGVNAGASIYSAKRQSSAANNAARAQADAAKYAADREAEANAAALQFQRDKAAQDAAQFETTQHANYDQWAARQRRIGAFGSSYLGLDPREIPPYVPSTPGATTGGTSPTTPSGDIPKSTGDVNKDLALANELAYGGTHHVDPNYWLQAGYQRDPQYFFQKMLGMDAGGQDKPTMGPYAKTAATSAPRTTPTTPTTSASSLTAPLGQYTYTRPSLVRTPALAPSSSWPVDDPSRIRQLASYL